MTVFFVVGAVGLVLLVITLIAGEVVEGIFDGIGGEWLSGAGLAGFVGAFGFAGALAYDLGGQSVAIGIVVGLLAGAAMGALVAAGTRFLKKGESDSTVRTASLVGRACSVSNPIPVDGYGEVTLVAAGHITRLNARAAAPIPVGSNVTITAILSATAVMVEPVSAVAPQVDQDVALDEMPPTPPPAAVEPVVDVGPAAQPREPDARQPDVRDPDPRDPDPRDPDVRDPDVRDPDVRQPDVRDPDVRDPDSHQPEADEPGPDQPARRAAPDEEPEHRGPEFTQPPEHTWSPWARDDQQR